MKDKSIPFHSVTQLLCEVSRPGEVFYAVHGLPFNYRVSNYGQVVNLGNIVHKSDGKICVYQPRLMSITISTEGYATIHINVNGKRKVFRIHQMVAKAFVLNKENKPIINHKDGNKLNNYYKNLEWSTHSENLQHAYDNNLRTYNLIAAHQSRKNNRV